MPRMLVTSLSLAENQPEILSGIALLKCWLGKCSGERINFILPCLARVTRSCFSVSEELRQESKRLAREIVKARKEKMKKETKEKEESSDAGSGEGMTSPNKRPCYASALSVCSLRNIIVGLFIQPNIFAMRGKLGQMQQDYLAW